MLDPTLSPLVAGMAASFDDTMRKEFRDRPRGCSRTPEEHAEHERLRARRKSQRQARKKGRGR